MSDHPLATAPITGPWDYPQAEEWLSQSVIPVRLSANTDSGYPIILSLWYLYDDGALWCAVHNTAHIYKVISKDPRCAFEVAPNEPPYCGVRGRVNVTIVPEEGERVLRSVMDRFLGSSSPRLREWLLSRADDEVALRLEPVSLFTWDYTQRMTRQD